MQKLRPMMIGALAAFALQGSAVQAQERGAGDEAIETFTRDDLKLALEGIGASWEPTESGQSLNISFKAGIKANAALMACKKDSDEEDCYGTSVLATFAKPTGKTDAQINAAINKYNYLENFGRAYISPNDRISARIYIISDGDITRENYRTQLKLWENSLSDFIGYLYESEEEKAD